MSTIVLDSIFKFCEGKEQELLNELLNKFNLENPDLGILKTIRSFIGHFPQLVSFDQLSKIFLGYLNNLPIPKIPTIIQIGSIEHEICLILSELVGGCEEIVQYILTSIKEITKQNNKQLFKLTTSCYIYSEYLNDTYKDHEAIQSNEKDYETLLQVFELGIKFLQSEERKIRKPIELILFPLFNKYMTNKFQNLLINKCFELNNTNSKIILENTLHLILILNKIFFQKINEKSDNKQKQETKEEKALWNFFERGLLEGSKFTNKETLEILKLYINEMYLNDKNENENTSEKTEKKYGWKKHQWNIYFHLLSLIQNDTKHLLKENWYNVNELFQNLTKEDTKVVRLILILFINGIRLVRFTTTSILTFLQYFKLGFDLPEIDNFLFDYILLKLVKPKLIPKSQKKEYDQFIIHFFTNYFNNSVTKRDKEEQKAFLDRYLKLILNNVGSYKILEPHLQFFANIPKDINCSKEFSIRFSKFAPMISDIGKTRNSNFQEKLMKAWLNLLDWEEITFESFFEFIELIELRSGNIISNERHWQLIESEMDSNVAAGDYFLKIFDQINEELSTKIDNYFILEYYNICNWNCKVINLLINNPKNANLINDYLSNQLKKINKNLSNEKNSITYQFDFSIFISFIKYNIFDNILIMNFDNELLTLIKLCLDSFFKIINNNFGPTAKEINSNNNEISENQFNLIKFLNIFIKIIFNSKLLCSNKKIIIEFDKFVNKLFDIIHKFINGENSNTNDNNDNDNNTRNNNNSIKLLYLQLLIRTINYNNKLIKKDNNELIRLIIDIELIKDKTEGKLFRNCFIKFLQLKWKILSLLLKNYDEQNLMIINSIFDKIWQTFEYSKDKLLPFLIQCLRYCLINNEDLLIQNKNQILDQFQRLSINHSNIIIICNFLFEKKNFVNKNYYELMKKYINWLIANPIKKKPGILNAFVSIFFDNLLQFYNQKEESNICLNFLNEISMIINSINYPKKLKKKQLEFETNPFNSNPIKAGIKFLIHTKKLSYTMGILLISILELCERNSDFGHKLFKILMGNKKNFIFTQEDYHCQNRLTDEIERKLRNLQFMVVLIPYTKVSLKDKIIEIFWKLYNQTSSVLGRKIFENWGVQYFLKYPQEITKDLFWEKLFDSRINSRPQILVSSIVILFTLSKSLNYETNSLLFEKMLKYFYTFNSSVSTNVKRTAQYCLRRIYSELPNINNDNDDESIKNNNNSSSSSSNNNNSNLKRGIILKFLKENKEANIGFYRICLDYPYGIENTSNGSISSVFIGWDQESNAGERKISIPISIINQISLILLSNYNSKLIRKIEKEFQFVQQKQTEFQKLIEKSKQNQQEILKKNKKRNPNSKNNRNDKQQNNNTDEKYINFQKKIKPWEELDLFDSNTENKKKQYNDNKKQELIICASLLEKVPNLGGLSRTSEIFSISELTISDTKHIKNPLFKKISVNSENWTNIKQVTKEEIPQFLTQKQNEGYVIIALEQTSDSVMLQDFKFPKKCVVLLGNEQKGIPHELLKKVSICIEIPQLGVVRSLNAHVSASILIWEYSKQFKLKLN
ncbi:RNA methyltransferase [Anaeramoeba flamelloides]|uniref:RNA methyltransferase n=1 Tax=Anaeramoeba flamelloides TaxID=1746091 RepID=A0ABQ8Z4C0_9EUKA|nr:RNA methyltransferase [Anaeramoeba flamelloides]